MKNSGLTTQTWVLLIAAALLIACGALNFNYRLKHTPPPTDGIDWTITKEGVVAESVDQTHAGGRAGILPGDRLVAVSTDGERYEELATAEDVQIYLERAGLEGDIHYLVERPSFPVETRFYYADLYRLASFRDWTPRDLYLHFIGLIYLLVGLFVLFKQGGRAPFVTHFATLCLVAFTFHFYRSTGATEDVDSAVAFLDNAAFLFFAPLFLHFCMIYPLRRHLFDERRWRAGLLYLPAIVMLLLLVPFFFAQIPPQYAPKRLGDFLLRAELAHFAFALLAGAVLLARRFAQSKTAVVRQQLKWVVWGSGLAIAPFTLLYVVSYLFGGATSGVFNSGSESWLTDAAVVPLVLIPLTFGNSVVRYRLMDVDVVVRRAAVYALTTLAIAFMIGTIVAVVGFYLLDLRVGDGTSPNILSLPVVLAIVGMAVIVMTAAPLKNFLQERTNRLFYGERYDLRNGLLDFGRTLSATTALDPLLDALVSRLQQVLSVERVAIFIEDGRSASGYRVARAAGLSNEVLVPQDFREMIRTRSAGTGIVRADDLELAPESASFVRRALHYYVPCVVRGRMVAVIGLGRSADGALLSSEDLEILRTVSGYVAVAIENSLLYQEQRERAAELELLKEFNESIVESINVGLLAVDAEGQITRCNSALEEMLGVRRDEATGRRVEELFDADFTETLQQVLGAEGWRLNDVRHVYKLHTASQHGRSLVLNIALAPLRHIDERARAGTLVVLEDTTARTQLEEQLQQREKLSSIGLLAAGVAHEINTPLTGVSSYTQMLLGMMPENDPKHALLEKIRRQTDRAAGIVSNLLNFSRTGAGTEFVPVKINRVLEDTLQLLEPQLRESLIMIVREFDAELPEAFANAGKLQQVFTNLILNARDAAPDGGRVTLRTRAEEEQVVVEISDTGTGIAPENVARIYDPFFTTKGVGRGTGLGLAVSYGIVQEHAGHIAVESAPGRGTTFRLTLPIAGARARLQAASD
ncbi:MAG: PAS domain S-box protein [Pyrinomonadaceae bacterium]|nr:PAS domain S-box protein [Pyrinomonadaceae bacterium]